MLFYRAALPLSRRTLNFVAGVVRRHLKAIGSRWRLLHALPAPLRAHDRYQARLSSVHAITVPCVLALLTRTSRIVAWQIAL